MILSNVIYYSYPAGQVRSFLERWLFPVGTYLVEDGVQKVIRDKIIPTGIIYTMNVPAEAMEEWGYPPILEETANTMGQIMGHSELLYINNTYQFSDYSRYDFNLFDEEEKRIYREEHFETDLENAFRLGKRLVEAAMEPGPDL